MEVKYYETGSMANETYTYAVICAMYKGELIWVRHKDRLTWEIPGGRREVGEHIDDTAKRELYEETGADVFNIEAVSDYSVTRGNETKYGRLYRANVMTFQKIPDLEIAEKSVFKNWPNDLTYPHIQPLLIKRAKTDLIEKWFGRVRGKNVTVMTDHHQIAMIQKMWQDIDTEKTHIVNIKEEAIAKVTYDDVDLLIVALSIDTFVKGGYNQYFSPFTRPIHFQGNYAFIRLDITWESLMEAMQTPIEAIEQVIKRYKNLPETSHLAITTHKGTNLTCEVLAFKSKAYKIDERHAVNSIFFPPSEIAAGIVSNSANGKIVVDMTIGQLYQNGICLEAFGCVPEPVTIDIKNGRIEKIQATEMGARLTEHLFKLEEEARVVVELGIGLSQMTPTGTIGIDESILGSCHFGIGDGSFFGVPNVASIHLDLVINTPKIEVISKDTREA